MREDPADNIYSLWDELAEFPVGDDALRHMLKGL